MCKKRNEYCRSSKNDPNVEDREIGIELSIKKGYKLTAEVKVLRQHILNLVTEFETKLVESKLPYLSNIAQRLKPLVMDGLAEIHPSSLQVTKTGYTFIRNICMAFDARMIHKALKMQFFRRTI